MIFSYLLNMQSHPSWVCGLKLLYYFCICHFHNVTPFVGVWIETENRFYFLSPLEKVIFLRKRTIDCQ